MIDVQQFKDKELVCCDCGNTFIWTANEQSFYLSKGLAPVKRCSACRAYRKATLVKDSNWGAQHG